MNDLHAAPAAPTPTPATPHGPAPSVDIVPHLALVRGIAQRVARKYRLDLCHLDLDDLVSIGAEALLEAARRFDPSRRASFVTFAYYRVQGAMIDALRANGSYRHNTGGSGPGARQIFVVSLESHEEQCLAVPDGRQQPDQIADARTQVAWLRGALAGLAPRERRVVESYYFEDHNLDSIGAELGTSRSWTCRILQRAVDQLRAQLPSNP